MNLELIRKYEKEFLHMLHGGKVLMGKKDPITNTTKWYPSVLNPFVETSDTIVIVIDDMFVEFRKALAEGRHIQFFNTKERLYNSSKPLNTWQDIDKIRTHGRPSDYRIKPEEPEFKIGDYVRYIHANSQKPLRIVNINCERYYFENAEIILRIDEIEKWEPMRGEICIFWDNYMEEAFIARFNYITNEKDSKYMCMEDQSWWDNCMPFTGALPPHMKE